jgi:hypothetical protein
MHPSPRADTWGPFSPSERVTNATSSGAQNADVEVPGLESRVEPEPERQIHLGAAGCLDASRLAPSSSPLMNTACSPGTRVGSTITWQFIVLSAFTTRASGKAAWIRSPRLSSLQKASVGGKPCDASSGLAMSIRVLPERFSLPAALSASREATPAVQLTTSSPWPAASAKLPSAAASPASFAQATSRCRLGANPS